jgi:hypothetical protein
MRAARATHAEIQPAWSGDQKVGRRGRTRHPHARRQSSLPRRLHRCANGRTAAEGEGKPIRRIASCGRARGALQALCGRRPSPSGSESRDGACARACWADRSASPASLQIPIVSGKIERGPILNAQTPTRPLRPDATKRRAEKMNAALDAPLQGRAYAAPAGPSQSWPLILPGRRRSLCLGLAFDDEVLLLKVGVRVMRITSKGQVTHSGGHPGTGRSVASYGSRVRI